MAQQGKPPSIVVDTKYLNEIEKARRDLRALISGNQCAPNMLRLAWHDAATYDAKSKTGGPNGSVKKLYDKLNEELKSAIGLCDRVKKDHPTVTYADLYQLAGVIAVELTGGPSIDFVSGRPDSVDPVEEGRLPDANKGAEHLKQVFKRMGLSDKDIVAILGGLAVLDKASKAGKDPVKFDNSYFKELHEKLKEDASTGVHKFDNTYSKELYKEQKTDDSNGVQKSGNSYSKEPKEDDTKGVVELPTDKVFVQDPMFRRYVERYAKDGDLFFKEYAESHKKFSELGLLIIQSPASITPSPAAAQFITPSPKPRMNMATKATIGVTVSIIIIGCLYKFTRRAK